MHETVTWSPVQPPPFGSSSPPHDLPLTDTRRSHLGVASVVDAPEIADEPSLPEGPQPRLSLVIPTRNEVDNIAPLVRRLDAICPGVPMEFIFVDDSSDGTPAAIEAARSLTNRAIHLIHRPEPERTGGLGGAVVVGMKSARGPWVGVMDADLQHPPEIIERMLAVADRDESDLVIASRYREDGESGSFGHVRSMISKGSTLSAKAAFPRRLRGVTDPMSGFFLARSTSLDLTNLQPHGFKILFEILARSRNLRVAEVPFSFGTRHSGQSKASLREGLRYAQLLMDLRVSASTLRFLCFALVGITGLAANSVALIINTELLGIYYVVAALIATQVSTLWNFVLTDRWVYRQVKHRQTAGQRAAMFFAMNNVALLMRIPVLFTLTTVIGLHYAASNLVSLAALTVVRYATADRFIWGNGLAFLQNRRATAPVTVAPSLHDGVR